LKRLAPGTDQVAGRREALMKRIWLVLLAICSMNSLLLSSCPMGPPPEGVEHEGGGGGGGGY
jgi:hypothetical protein